MSAARRTRKRKHSESEVPFAAGFRLPTLKQSRDAIGLSKIPKMYDPGTESAHFKRIPQPISEDDWLAQYNEKGQSFKNFTRTCRWISCRKVKYTRQKFVSDGKNLKQRYPDGKIYLQPLGDFDQLCWDSSYPSIDDLADYTERFYSLPVVVLPAVKLKLPTKKGDLAYWNYGLNETITSSNAIRTSSRVQSKQCELNHRWSRGHVQLRVDSIHGLLRQQIADDALCLIGLTMVDLFEDETDLFVAGLAAGNQRVAVFSFARYDPSLSFSTEHWYDIWPSKQLDPLKKKELVLQLNQFTFVLLIFTNYSSCAVLTLLIDIKSYLSFSRSMEWRKKHDGLSQDWRL
ncbi:uncharacterized protein LOC111345618 isoform X2 [Stylophora pistillata]|uniref:uncharacterized protein LOC111345618 isoform X2 n=1 Tax=Stylophora pistillata TaxID=50429 RepID=UPI000C0467F6|nr:uncharacterized protein LOC111345618 isoform X2 [Stylophora pistillata]